jgi:hypothetical protein
MRNKEVDRMLEEFKRQWCDKTLYDYSVPYCPFDYGEHQFYEGHYLGDTYRYIKDKDIDHCLKCGKKKMLSSDKALHIDEDRR